MRSIILDRDGVINFESDQYIKSPAEWRPIPGSLEAIAALNRANFQVFIATNQSGVARNLYDIQTLEQIHAKFLTQLKNAGGQIKEIQYCPHHPDDDCPCRKPKPGMIDALQKKYAFDLGRTYFIGDSQKDLQAATAAGCKPLLVLTGNGEKVRGLLNWQHVPHFKDLAAAVAFVLAEKEYESC